MMRVLCIFLFFVLLSQSCYADEEPFGGVGLQVVPTVTGELVVLNVLEGAPAEHQGVLPGDLIYRVDNFDLYGSDFGKVISEYLWGPVGSRVEVFFRRPGVADDMHVELLRTKINPRLTVTPAVQGGGAAETQYGEK